MLECTDEIDVVGSTCVDPAFRSDVLRGFSAQRKYLSARWFYDHRGSELFEAITELPEYYPTRTERLLLANHAKEISLMTGKGRAVVEFGSGSSSKTPLLLSAINPSAYVPIDISGDFLRESASVLEERFPSLPIYPVEGDFTRPLKLPVEIEGLPNLGFFPGSTIGNLEPAAATDLLRTMASTLGHGGMLLIGMDRIKDPAILVPAYDDAQGITAAFNLNLLHRINRELDGSIPADLFKHVAIWSDEFARIEMHLEARSDLQFEVDGHRFSMKQGETIHTENSHKYGSRDAAVLLRAGGWNPVMEWVDEHGLFGLLLAVVSDS